MFIVYDTTRPFQRKEVERFETFREAEEYVRSLGVHTFEQDASYTGCADAFMLDGRLLAIEPEGFTL